jgi:hypothetical protein
MDPFELDVVEYLARWGIVCGVAVLIAAAAALQR